MSVILKLICRFKAVPIKIPAFFFFVGVNKLIVKFIWKCKVPRIVKITLKMSDIVGRLTLPGFKIDYKATVSKAVQYWNQYRKADQWNKIESLEIDPTYIDN